MDIKLIDDYIATYKGSLREGEAERVVFYRKLWGACAMCGDMGPAGATPPVPPGPELAACAAKGKHLLSEFPLPIDKQLFLATIHELTQIVDGEEAYARDFRDGFGDIARLLPSFVDEKNLVIAESDPQDYLSYVIRVCGMTGAVEGVAPVMGALTALALRVQLEPYASALMGALPDGSFGGELPRTCPVCGSTPTVGLVHIGPTEEESFTRLCCVQCGTIWDFEMLRCPHCGKRGPEVMGFYNLNDDRRHLIGGCNECGGYVRMVNVGQETGGVSIDVEDVLLTRLDEALIQLGDPENNKPPETAGQAAESSK